MEANKSLKLLPIIFGCAIVFVVGLFSLWRSGLSSMVDFNNQVNCLITQEKLWSARQNGNLVCVEGYITKSWAHPQYGIQNISIKSSPDLRGTVEISVMPSFGHVPDAFKQATFVRTVGLVSYWDGQPQIRPISNTAFTVKSQSPCSGGVAIRSLNNSIGKTQFIGPILPVKAQPFKTKAGKQHLSLAFVVDRQVVQGIMWAGTWTSSTQALLTSNQPVCLLAKPSIYKGELSIVVERVLSP